MPYWAVVRPRPPLASGSFRKGRHQFQQLRFAEAEGQDKAEDQPDVALAEKSAEGAEEFAQRIAAGGHGVVALRPRQHHFGARRRRRRTRPASTKSTIDQA
jgi:heme A synthase